MLLLLHGFCTQRLSQLIDPKSIVAVRVTTLLENLEKSGNVKVGRENGKSGKSRETQ